MTGGEILEYFKNREFRGFGSLGAEHPTARCLAGSGAAGPGGGQEANPFASLSPLIAIKMRSGHQTSA